MLVSQKKKNTKRKKKQRTKKTTSKLEGNAHNNNNSNTSGVRIKANLILSRTKSDQKVTYRGTKLNTSNGKVKKINPSMTYSNLLPMVIYGNAPINNNINVTPRSRGDCESAIGTLMTQHYQPSFQFGDAGNIAAILNKTRCLCSETELLEEITDQLLDLEPPITVILSGFLYNGTSLSPNTTDAFDQPSPNISRVRKSGSKSMASDSWRLTGWPTHEDESLIAALLGYAERDSTSYKSISVPYHSSNKISRQISRSKETNNSNNNNIINPQQNHGHNTQVKIRIPRSKNDSFFREEFEENTEFKHHTDISQYIKEYRSQITYKIDTLSCDKQTNNSEMTPPHASRSIPISAPLLQTGALLDRLSALEETGKAVELRIQKSMVKHIKDQTNSLFEEVRQTVTKDWSNDTRTNKNTSKTSRTTERGPPKIFLSDNPDSTGLCCILGSSIPRNTTSAKCHLKKRYSRKSTKSKSVQRSQLLSAHSTTCTNNNAMILNVSTNSQHKSIPTTHNTDEHVTHIRSQSQQNPEIYHHIDFDPSIHPLIITNEERRHHSLFERRPHHQLDFCVKPDSPQSMIISLDDMDAARQKLNKGGIFFYDNSLLVVSKFKQPNQIDTSSDKDIIF